jgi:hypothetical protein
VCACALALLAAACAPRPWWDDPSRPRCCADVPSCSTALLRSPEGAASEAEAPCWSDALDFLERTPQARSLVLELLASESKERRQLGARLSRRALVSPGGDEGLVDALVQAWFAHRDWLVFQVLSWVHDAPGTRPLWRDVLHDDRFADPLSTAAERLATMGDADPVTLERLETLATTHWDGEVRLTAARAYAQLAPGRHVAPALNRCVRKVQQRSRAPCVTVVVTPLRSAEREWGARRGGEEGDAARATVL